MFTYFRQISLVLNCSPIIKNCLMVNMAILQDQLKHEWKICFGNFSYLMQNSPIM